MAEKTAQIKQNVAAVRERITRAAKKVHRDPQDVKLVAVTKLMPVDTIKAGIEAGLRSFGENYPEQAAKKIESLGLEIDVEWHMIGHIQSRKTDTVCQYFDMVHSVDRMKIARYLDRYARQRSRIMPVLIEVNLSGEESKYGWEASDEKRWPELATDFKKIAALENITVHGLMSMPPLFDDPERTRPIYQRLNRLQQFLQDEIPEADWGELSIGTSFDFEVAVEEGATLVRV
ncbi:MAG: YggS family pyridoxal phosphate-dependent enzyme, partial [Brevefilum sp.]